MISRADTDPIAHRAPSAERSSRFRTFPRIDTAGWRRFLFAVAGLAMALFLALYASTLHDVGEYTPAALIASLSLLITAILAVLTVPALARRTVLERLMVKIDYELTREGAVYLLLVVAIIVAALNTG